MQFHEKKWKAKRNIENDDGNSTAIDELSK